MPTPTPLESTIKRLAEKHAAQQKVFSELLPEIQNLLPSDTFTVGCHPAPRGSHQSLALAANVSTVHADAYDWYFRHPIPGGTLVGIVECLNQSTGVAGLGLIVFSAEGSVYGVVLGREKTTIAEDLKTVKDSHRLGMFVVNLVEQSYTAISHGNLAELNTAKR